MFYPVGESANEIVPASLKEDVILLVVLKGRGKISTFKGIVSCENADSAHQIQRVLEVEGNGVKGIVLVEP